MATERVAFCDAAPKAAAAAAAGKPAPAAPAAPKATVTQVASAPASGSKPAAAAAPADNATPAAAAAAATPAAAAAEDDDEGEIDLECNCLRTMKQGPCAEAFMTSGRCYNASKVSRRLLGPDHESMTCHLELPIISKKLIRLPTQQIKRNSVGDYLRYLIYFCEKTKQI